MTADDAELAQLRAAFETAGPPPDPASCPSPETILAAVRGELPPDDIRAVVDHTAACPACAEDWRLAVAFEEESADQAVQILPAPAPSPWHRHLSRYAAAAAAVVLLAVGLQVWHENTEQPPRMRGGSDLVLKTAASLPREKCLLVWSYPAKATYDIEVYNPLSGDMVAEKEGLKGLGELSYLVAPSALRDIPAGTRLEWKVTAALPRSNLSPREISKTSSFTLE